MPPKKSAEESAVTLTEAKALYSIETAVLGFGVLLNFTCDGFIAISSDGQAIAENLGAIGLISDAPTTIPPIVVRCD